MSRILSFATPQIAVEDELLLRLKLKKHETKWMQSILSAIPWIEALDPIQLRTEQMCFYKASRFFVFHCDDIPRWPLPKPILPSADYPREMIPTNVEIKSAIEWFRGNNRASGRTFLMAVNFVEIALANPEYEIHFWDHHPSDGGIASVDNCIKSIAWDILGARGQIVVGRGYLIAAREGKTEINKQGTIGRPRW